jgi:hypothetical protein
MPSLNVTFTGNSAPLLTEIAKVRGGIRANLQKDLATWAATGASPDPAKLFKKGEEAGNGWFKGFLSRMSGTGSGGMAQLVSVVSNTLSSLGSGMSPARIFAQQAPNVLQAFHSMGVLAFGTIVAAAATAAMLIYAQFRGMKDAVAALRFNFDGTMDYVAKIKKTHSEVENQLRGIRDAARDTVEAYNSAAAKAERLASITKKAFDNERAIADLRKERDLITARTPEQKAAVEARYAQQEIDRRKREMTSESARSQSAVDDLKKERDLKLAKANALTSSTGKQLLSEADSAARLDYIKKRAEAAEAFLKDNTYMTHFQEKMGVMYGGSPTSVKDRAMEVYNVKESAKINAQKAIDALKAETDAQAADEIIRKRKADLVKQAGESEKKSVEIALKQNETNAANRIEIEQATTTASMREENARLSNLYGMSDPKQTLSSNQQIGAYAGSYQPTMLTETKKIQQHVKTTAEILTSLQHKLMPGDNVDNHF